jgi:hypothetical protein
MRARLSGRLVDATLTRPANSALDVNNPTAAPTGSPTTFSVEAYAFAYGRDDIDGTRILANDYIVFLLRTSAVLPQTGDLIDVPPPGEAGSKTGSVIAIEAVTEAFVTMQVRG